MNPVGRKKIFPVLYHISLNDTAKPPPGTAVTEMVSEAVTVSVNMS